MNNRDHALQALYSAEVNFSISCFYDGGFNWFLGDELNGIKRRGNAPTWTEAVDELVMAACDEYLITIGIYTSPTLMNQEFGRIPRLPKPECSRLLHNPSARVIIIESEQTDSAAAIAQREQY